MMRGFNTLNHHFKQKKHKNQNEKACYSAIAT